MELVIIVLAIIFSIWSEVNKKKKEKDLDFDFSDLSNIEDFVKGKSGPTPGSSGMHASNAGLMGQTTLEKKERKQKKSRKKQKKRKKEEIDTSSLEFPPLEDNASLLPASSKRSSSFSDADDNNFAFNRKTLIQAFILSEAMHRYDIDRIYERVPDVRQDDE
ncbi:MAG: hypothetical protein ACQETH_07520 [Candidatus Rifleibacteriota bacterium]